MVKGSAAMLVVKRSVGVAPEVNIMIASEPASEHPSEEEMTSPKRLPVAPREGILSFKRSLYRKDKWDEMAFMLALIKYEHYLCL